MFESVNALSRRLPRSELTNDPRNDFRAREQYISNGRLLKSEAFACMVRALMAALRSGWHQVTRPALSSPSHQA